MSMQSILRNMKFSSRRALRCALERYFAESRYAAIPGPMHSTRNSLRGRCRGLFLALIFSGGSGIGSSRRGRNGHKSKTFAGHFVAPQMVSSGGIKTEYLSRRFREDHVSIKQQGYERPTFQAGRPEHRAAQA